MDRVTACPTPSSNETAKLSSTPRAAYRRPAAATGAASPSAGHRGSKKPVTMRKGRGQSSGSDMAASYPSSRPGRIRSHTRRTTSAVTASSPRSARAASNTAGIEATRPWYRPFSRAHPKSCTPINGAPTAIRSSATIASHVCMPPSEIPVMPMRAGSTNDCSLIQSRTNGTSATLSRRKG